VFLLYGTWFHYAQQNVVFNVNWFHRSVWMLVGFFKEDGRGLNKWSDRDRGLNDWGAAQNRSATLMPILRRMRFLQQFLTCFGAHTVTHENWRTPLCQPSGLESGSQSLSAIVSLELRFRVPTAIPTPTPIICWRLIAIFGAVSHTPSARPSRMKIVKHKIKPRSGGWF
jgi:hypothetical protein